MADSIGLGDEAQEFALLKGLQVMLVLGPHKRRETCNHVDESVSVTVYWPYVVYMEEPLNERFPWADWGPAFCCHPGVL